MTDDTAKLAREHIEVPWDELRSARVHKRALEAFRNETLIDDEFEDGQGFADEQNDGACKPSIHDDCSAREGHDCNAPDSAAAHGQDAAATGQDAAATGQDAARASRIVNPAEPDNSKRWWVLAAALLTAAAALWMLAPRIRPRATTATWKVASTLRFADGSRSLLGHGAQVEVVRDSAPEVRVKQAAGKVRYEITRRQKRQFVVMAGGVEVTVMGTIFEVTVGERRVNVEVQRGKVRVRQSSRVVELVAGEHIAMDASAPRSSAASAAPRIHTVASARAVHRASDNSDQKVKRAAAGGRGAADSSLGGGASIPAAERLLRAADQARVSGNLAEAAHVLRKLVRRHPRDKRVTVALFTLGKVERQQGHFVQAGQAFEQCGTALRGDALAAAANSWLAAGNSSRARRAATLYMQHFPDGVHAAAMRGIVH